MIESKRRRGKNLRGSLGGRSVPWSGEGLSTPPPSALSSARPCPSSICPGHLSIVWIDGAKEIIHLGLSELYEAVLVRTEGEDSQDSVGSPYASYHLTETKTDNIDI